MRKLSTRDVLNRLLAIHYRSLPIYLTHAVPWVPRGNERALEVLRHIVADQKKMANRIADYILEHHGRVDTGEFAMEFTGLHDVSLDYLVGRLIELQKRDISIIQQCVEELRGNESFPDRAAARALAEEALGAARAHLESLEELSGPKW